MGIPRKLLAEDEEIVVSLRTHWKALVGPVVVVILMAALAVFLVAIIPASQYQEYLQIGIVVVAALVCLVWTVLPFLRWWTTTYTVTNRRIITRQGILTRTGRDIPLTRINDVSHERQITDRMLGCGTLIIWSAGEQGRVVLTDVPRVQTVRQRIADLLYGGQEDGYQQGPPGSQGSAGPTR